jgi:hypothetical protein
MTGWPEAKVRANRPAISVLMKDGDAIGQVQVGESFTIGGSYSSGDWHPAFQSRLIFLARLHL